MMNKTELIEMTDEALNDVLAQYIKGTEAGGDITPEEAQIWDEMVESIASAFEGLAGRNKKEGN